MAGKLTLTMIKPKAVAENHTGEILAMINKAGYKIKSLKMTWLTQSQAAQFYSVHKARPFFSGLVASMTSGPIVAVLLEKENAIADFRTLIGATNPADAAEGTIRNKFATDIENNAVHGSDSDENAIIEGNFHFPVKEQFEY